MNAVQDLPQKYITRGYRLTKGLRVLRRVRVPDLSPSYITNGPETKPLVAPAAVTGRWMLHSRDYLPWNTGWAKLSELIEAYSIHDATTNDAVDLAVPRDGTLEVVNSRTALVVSKNWVLLLGLLGRYGKRTDKGVLQHGGTRRDDYGERALIKSILLPVARRRRPEDGMPVMGGPGRADSDGEEYASEDSGPEERERRSDAMLVKRNAYGELSIELKPRLTIHGVTGTMQALGRHKGSWSYLTSISFVPHSAREIFPKDSKSKGDSEPMETLFWLAQGCLLCEVTADGRRVVISLEEPEPKDEQVHIDRDREDRILVYSLQETDDLPLSIGESARALGITEPQMFRFLPLQGAADEIHAPSAEERGGVGRARFHTEIHGPWVVHSDMVEYVTRAFPRKDLEKIIGALLGLEWDEWGFLLRKDKFLGCLMWRAAGILRRGYIRMAEFRDALGMGTDPLRALRWRVTKEFHQRVTADRILLDNALSGALAESSHVLPLRLALGALFVLDDRFRNQVQVAGARMAGVEGPISYDESSDAVRADAEWLGYRLQDLAGAYTDRLQSERPAKSVGGHSGGFGPVLAMPAIYVGGGGAERAAKSVMPMVQGRGRVDREDSVGIGAIEDQNNNLTPPDPAKLGYVEFPEDEHDVMGEPESQPKPEPDVLPKAEPEPAVQTTILLSDIDELTLRAMGVRYNPGTDSSYVTVDRPVAAWELEMFRSYTTSLRELHALAEKQVSGPIGSLEYDYGSRTLRWYKDKGDDKAKDKDRGVDTHQDEEERADVAQWVLEGELVRVAGAEKVVQISAREAVLVALWVANRCALWLGSLDSGPLLHFVEELDPHVYVL